MTHEYNILCTFWGLMLLANRQQHTYNRTGYLEAYSSSGTSSSASLRGFLVTGGPMSGTRCGKGGGAIGGGIPGTGGAEFGSCIIPAFGDIILMGGAKLGWMERVNNKLLTVT